MQMNTSYTVIGKYERDEMTPSIDTAKKLASFLDSTVGYLLGETEEENIFKDKEMLNRLQIIRNLDLKTKEHILYALDSMLRDAKTKQAYAS